MKLTGLFFGSFNPVHHGHLIIAQYMLNFTPLEELWLVVSPHNPFKNIADLEEEQERLKMVNIALDGHPQMFACPEEFSLEKPSYTIRTLRHLSIKYPDRSFVLILGSDNLEKFEAWKEYQEILEKHQLYVYLREDFKGSPLTTHPKVKMFHAPLLDISSTYIRELIHKGKAITYLLPGEVEDYIIKKGLYSKG